MVKVTSFVKCWEWTLVLESALTEVEKWCVEGMCMLKVFLSEKILGLKGYNPLNPIVHFWLHHMAHCTETIVSAFWCVGSVLAETERVGQREVGGVTCRMLCTWWPLGLTVKGSWLAPGGPPLAMTTWIGFTL